jgi:hypothetical protein
MNTTPSSGPIRSSGAAARRWIWRSPRRAPGLTSAERRPLAVLLIANVISITGSSLTLMGVPWFVLQSAGSAADAGVVAFSAMLPPGRSARARAGPRTRDRRRPARSRPARRCRCTAAARRQWRCLSSGHRSRRPPAPPADRRGAPQHSRVRIPHAVCVPLRARQQVLHPVRRGVPGMLSYRPAVLARQPGQQSHHERPRPAPRLHPAETCPDLGHQLIEYPRPADGVYAVASGHQTIITCQHKPG